MYPTPAFDNQSVKLDINHEAFHRLLEPVWIKTQVFNKDFGLMSWEYVCWEVKKGFRTDGASIPRLLWGWLNPINWKILIPAVGHDYMCRYQTIHTPFVYNELTGVITEKMDTFTFKRIKGDMFMFNKMGRFGAGLFYRIPVFIAISSWGIFQNKNNQI